MSNQSFASLRLCGNHQFVGSANTRTKRFPAKAQRRKGSILPAHFHLATGALVVALGLVLCLSSATAQAQNWPSFRGPNASGVTDGAKPPTNWNAVKSQNILWKTPIPGLSHSSPIIWANRVFLITAISSDPKAGFNAKERGIDLAVGLPPRVS